MRGERGAAERGTVLLLAGTREARALAEEAAGLDLLVSLAGRTARPGWCAHRVRVGGFGGEDGFRAALGGVAAVLDATHPYAATMSERAARLSAERGVPHLRLARAPYPPDPAWRRHPDAEACAEALPEGARVLLTSGPGTLAAFEGRGLRLACRRVDPAPPRAGVEWVVGLSSGEGAERALLSRLGATHLVTKDSGGPTHKLDAARALGLEVHVIDRPPPPPGPETHDPAVAAAFLRAHARPL